MSAAQLVEVDDMRVWKHEGGAAPSSEDLVRRAAGESYQRVSGWDQDIEVRIVQLGAGVVRVAQVVHRLHE